MKANFSDEVLTKIGQNAVAKAIEVHRRMGRPIVVWKDERVQWIMPEEIEPRALPGDEWQPPQNNGS